MVEAEGSANVDGKQPNSNAVTDPAAASFSQAFSAFSDSIVDSMKKVHDLANGAASNFLYGVGTVTLVIVLFLRLRPGGIQISDLQPVEFVSMVTFALVLFVTATFLRFYVRFRPILPPDGEKSVG